MCICVINFYITCHLSFFGVPYSSTMTRVNSHIAIFCNSFQLMRQRYSVVLTEPLSPGPISSCMQQFTAGRGVPDNLITGDTAEHTAVHTCVITHTIQGHLWLSSLVKLFCVRMHCVCNPFLCAYNILCWVIVTAVGKVGHCVSAMSLWQPTYPSVFTSWCCTSGLVGE